jgi:hypothetical protein
MWGKPSNSPGTLANVYAGLSTFSFTDGHAKAMNPIQTIYQGAYNNGNCDSGFFYMWDATRTE